MRTFSLLLFIIITFSCQNENRNLLVINTNAKNYSKEYLSQIFKKSEIVKLETLDTCLVRHVSQIVKTKDYIFINDMNKVLQFDSDGKFIRQIGSIGHGPGQYYGVFGMTIDTSSKSVIISAIYQLLCYDFNGRFLNSILKTGDFTTDYMCFINGQLWTYNKRLVIPIDKGKFLEQGWLYIYDRQLNITDSILTRQVFVNNRAFQFGNLPNILSVLKSGIYIYCPVSAPEPLLRDTVYRISEFKMIPSIKLDFSEILSLRDDLKLDANTMSPEDFRSNINLIRSVNIKNIYRTEEFVFVEYDNRGKPYFFCYDIIHQLSYNMSEGLTDDLFGIGKPVQLIPLDLLEGKFCFVKNGYEVPSIIDGVNENSNPVIFFLKTKE
ncbi:MAG: 6-bladed beta-propeller [Bacteroidales bacterium]|nr:6-bladed beta-propeller [Bacteroidales bacterium]